MRDSQKYEMYCRALGESLNEIIKEAIDKRRSSIGTENEDFDAGYLNGFYRIITLMQQHAEISEIPYNDLGIDYDETELI